MWSYAQFLKLIAAIQLNITLTTPAVDPLIAELVEAEGANAEASLTDDIDFVEFYP